MQSLLARGRGARCWAAKRRTRHVAGVVVVAVVVCAALEGAAECYPRTSAQYPGMYDHVADT